MSDTDRLYALLRVAGPAGVHTLDLRAKGYSGNPSQRATDVEKKYGVSIHRKTERRGKRNGSRYTLLEGVGVCAGEGGKARKESLLETPEVEKVCADSGDSWGAPSLAPQEARLFALPSMNPLTDSEAA